MIISIDESKAVLAAQYANRLNQMNEHRCKACSPEYEKMLEGFKKMIKHPEDEVLICTEHDKVLGVLALSVERENKYLEAVGGVYAEEDYQDIAMQFYKYFKEKYSGFHFDAAYPKENIEAAYFMESIGAKCISSEIEVCIKKGEPICSKGKGQVIPINEKYYKQFSRLHDKVFSNVYWTSKRILSALDKFHVFIALEKDELVGAIATSALGNKREEIYFIEIDEKYRGQGYSNGLLEKSIEKAFSSLTNELIAMVAEDNAPAIHLYETFGFRKSDTCVTYSIESL